MKRIILVTLVICSFVNISAAPRNQARHSAPSAASRSSNNAPGKKPDALGLTGNRSSGLALKQPPKPTTKPMASKSTPAKRNTVVDPSSKLGKFKAEQKNGKYKPYKA